MQTVKLLPFFIKDTHEPSLSREVSILTETWVFKFSHELPEKDSENSRNCKGKWLEILRVGKCQGFKGK